MTIMGGLMTCGPMYITAAVGSVIMRDNRLV